MSACGLAVAGRVAAALALADMGGAHNGRKSVNVSALEKFEDGAVVDAKALLDAGILSKCTYGVKILGNGEITKKLTVKASAFSESAKAKIEAAGGKAEVV